MVKAYSYIRFSTPEQRLGDSLRRQLDLARAYAAEHSLELDESLRDEGRSAFSGKHRDDRAALGRFLSMVESGRVAKGSYLLVESLDRLSREHVLPAINLFTTIINAGVIIVTLKDKKSYSADTINAQPMDLMWSIMVMMRGHEESATKSFRLSETWTKKRLAAAETGKAMTAICPGWLQKKGDAYEPIKKHVEIVKRIFEDCVAGYGTRAIASRLNQEGVEPWGTGKRRGRIWYDSYVKKVLGNPAVLGEFTPRSPQAGGTEATAVSTLYGYYPAIIEKELFWKAKAALKARKSSTIRSAPGKHRNVLSGLLRCGFCRGGMHYISKGNGPKAGKPYLQCGSSLLKGGCSHSRRHIYEAVEGHVLLNLNTSFVSHDAEAEDVGALVLARDEASAQLGRMMDLVGMGIGGDMAIQRTAAAEIKLVQAQRALEAAQQKQALGQIQADLRSNLIEVAQTAIRLREYPNDVELRADTANRLLSLLRSVTVSPDRIALAYHGSDAEAMSWAIRADFADQVTRDLLRNAERSTVAPKQAREVPSPIRQRVPGLRFSDLD